MTLAAVAAGASAETFTAVMDHVAQGFEALGAAIMVVGVIWSFVLAVVAVRRSGWSAKAYLVLRQAFGGTLLLGVEVLVAADLVRTVAVAPTLNNVLVLGLIVVIRTFLSFSLETEIEGVAPWRRAAIGGAGTIRRASASALEPEDAVLIPDRRGWTPRLVIMPQAGPVDEAARPSLGCLSRRRWVSLKPASGLVWRDGGLAMVHAVTPAATRRTWT